MTPEEQLLPLICRHNVSDTDRSKTRQLLNSALDWDRVLQLCSLQDVYPLAYENLRVLNFADVPIHARDHLQALSRLNAFRNQHRVEELSTILAGLNRHGIATIPLKGLPLAHRLYNNVGFRAMSDTDILVQPQFTDVALNALTGLGYSPVIPQYQAELLETNIECQLVKFDAIGHSLLELHWAILWNSKLDQKALDDLWSEARPEVIFGAPAVRMSPEWEFLLLATHAARNQWEGLKWLADIHDMCSTCAIDWTKVMKKAQDFGWVTIVQTTFIACNVLFDTTIPAEIPRFERPPWLVLFPSTRTVVSRRLLPFRWIEGRLSKLRYFWSLLFIQQADDWKYSRYLPRRVRFLYFPIRLANLVRKYGPGVWKGVFDESHHASEAQARVRQK